MTRAARQAGVTLAELTVVLSILAILAAFAVPAGLDGWRRET
ncbi:prepilin-type N-terminal cleavage/methylation domain-containing protein, partial [Ralstonia solanacearum]